LLEAQIQRALRYPGLAQARRQQGVVLLHFTMDREGNVLTADIRKSSDFVLLDQESLDLIHRAEPLAKPPPEAPGDPIELTVPVLFHLPGYR
jgi:periplasmic protein TonB